MNKLYPLVLSIGIGTAPFLADAPKREYAPVTVVQELQEPTSTVDSLDILIEALIFVESRGKENAIGDKHLGEPSVGILQIRPVMVAEVNRILRKQKIKKRFKLKDRFSREKSIEMFMIWKGYYHKDSNFEAIARSWNGGPGWKKIKRTRKYWAKVEKQLNEYKSI